MSHSGIIPDSSMKNRPTTSSRRVYSTATWTISTTPLALDWIACSQRVAADFADRSQNDSSREIFSLPRGVKSEAKHMTCPSHYSEKLSLSQHRARFEVRSGHIPSCQARF
ncbi:unnamed protein product [Microthlaspi erraticum]|uniref:Uncharacterized protein n=1 Tax=Microthlaspi erraticum TaxID=1685480 RepID=A0A6D2JH75_9BRAS|nr:unnamed protein product [Microthlaspi erraticum]